jgi:hypothetical protein
VGDLLADRTQGLTDPDDAPEAPEHPVSRTGDLWLLGRHRLLCGDSTVAADVERVLAGRCGPSPQQGRGDFGERCLDLALDTGDRRLDIGGAASVVEIEAERGQHLLRAEMHGQHLMGADDAWCHLGDALDFGADFRMHCLAGEEALTFKREERCSRRQHRADPQRGDTVEVWHFEYFGKRDADQGDDQADQRGTVLE